MNTRIKLLRKNLSLSGEKFGNKLGITRGAVSNIENGNRKVTEQMIKSICREFNVNEEWLRTGKGKMFPEIPNSTMEQLKNEYDLDDFSYTLINEYLNLSPQQRKVVRELFFNIMSNEKFFSDSMITEDKSGQLSVDLNQNADASSKIPTFPDKDLPELSIDEKVALHQQELEREEKKQQKGSKHIEKKA